MAGARVAADLVLQRRCVRCLPASSATALPGLVWRPLVAPAARYPWSVLWRADDRTEAVSAFVRNARRLSVEQSWLEPAPELFGEAV